MNRGDTDRMDDFLGAEYRMAADAVDAGDYEAAWHHLERAHIVAQLRLGPHCTSHLRMLQLATRQRDWRELRGQVLRLVLAPLGNLTGKLPRGNTGRADVSAFSPMPYPDDLADVLPRPAPDLES